MRNAGLEEAQAGIKIGGRNINNLRYADDTTLMAQGAAFAGNVLTEGAEGRQRCPCCRGPSAGLWGQGCRAGGKGPSPLCMLSF